MPFFHLHIQQADFRQQYCMSDSLIRRATVVKAAQERLWCMRAVCRMTNMLLCCCGDGPQGKLELLDKVPMLKCLTDEHKQLLAGTLEQVRGREWGKGG